MKFEIFPLGHTFNELFSGSSVLGFCLIGTVNAILMLLIAYRYFQVMQQCGYDGYEYKKWLLRKDNANLLGLTMLTQMSLLGFLLTNMAFSVFSGWWVPFCGFVPYAIFLIVHLSGEKKAKNKLPLVLTRRLVRLMVVFAVLTIIFNILFIFIANGIALMLPDGYLLSKFRYAVICLFPVLTPFILLLSYYITKPFENANNKKYVESAKTKLESLDKLIKIGITGSYGKTTVKEVLKTLLSVKYKVLSTPESYNTPLGISKTVNNLDDSYDVFIAEMGARRVGDIKELTNIVKPNVAIITGVTGQHLETFLTINNVKKTKYELIENMSGGTAYFSADNEYTLEMFNKCPFEKYLAGIDNEKGAILYATDVLVSEEGTTFTLNYKGESQVVTTKLYGKHNVQDICLASIVAINLGVSFSEVCATIPTINQIKHRLELTVNESGVKILDDGYNANVEGVKKAVEVLKVFSGKKVVITPGIVELGVYEYERNYEFGKTLSTACDEVILVGRGSALRIREGLLSEGFSSDKIYMVKDLEGAKEQLTSIISAGDTVLFINDLPDKYS